MLRPLITEHRLVVAGFLTVVIVTTWVSVAMFTFGAVRSWRIAQLETAVRLLQDEKGARESERDAERRALRAELDEIGRTLYAAPSAPEATRPPVRRPAAVETWMINSTNELRKRLEAIERRVYQLER